MGKSADKVTQILIRLIDHSIFPAVLVIASKIIGIFIFLRFYNVSYKISGLKLVLENPDDYILVNTFSSVLMLASIVAGLFLVIFKANVLHNTHISPNLSTKLHDMNLEELISSTKTVYSQCYIWVAYVWLLTFILAIQWHFGLSAWWLIYVCLGFASFSSLFLALDLHKEFAADKLLFFKVKKVSKGMFSEYIEQELS